jgi:hypothetical protein
MKDFLIKYVRENDQTYALRENLRMMREISSGMSYLHENEILREWALPLLIYQIEI